MDSYDYESVVMFRERFRVLLEGLTSSIPTALAPLKSMSDEQKLATELLAICVQLGSILQCPALRVDDAVTSAYRRALDNIVPSIGDYAASLTVRCLDQVVVYGKALKECEVQGLDEEESPQARMAAIAMAQCYGRIVVEFMRTVEDHLARLEHPQPWPVGFHV